jgi:O-antigen/teichoic acid export membrane protein
MSAAPAERGFGQAMASGAFWMICARMAFRLIGLASTVILARLLVPEDFGIVAMAMIVVAFVEVMGEFAFDAALIQRQDATREHYDTVWTLSLIRGVVSAIVMLAAAWPLAALFGEPALAPVLAVLAATQLVIHAINPATVDFRKHFNFGREFYFMVLPKLVSFGLTVGLAVLWRSYWALVAGYIGYGLVRVAASYMLVSFRPRLTLAKWRDIFGFSGWMLVMSIGYALRMRLSAIVVGSSAGAHTLGVFTIAHELANLATTELAAPLRRALYPGFARIQADRPRLRAAVLNAFSLVCLVCMPIVAGTALCAEQIVYILLGSGWGDAVPFLQVLALAGIMTTCLGHAHPAYLALNRPDVGAYVTIGEVALLLPTILLFHAWMGTIGVAWAVVAVEAVMLGVEVAMLRWLVGVRVRDWFARAWRPTIAVGAMSLAVISLQAQLPAADGVLDHTRTLLLCASFGALVYVVSETVLWAVSGRGGDSAERHLLRFAGQLGRQRFSTSAG